MKQTTTHSLGVNMTLNNGPPFLTMKHIWLQMRSIPRKLARTFLPGTFLVISSNVLKATLSFCSKTLQTQSLLGPQDVILFPWIHVAVFSMGITVSTAGTFTSCQSFLSMDQPLSSWLPSATFIRCLARWERCLQLLPATLNRGFCGRTWPTGLGPWWRQPRCWENCLVLFHDRHWHKASGRCVLTISQLPISDYKWSSNRARLSSFGLTSRYKTLWKTLFAQRSETHDMAPLKLHVVALTKKLATAH